MFRKVTPGTTSRLTIVDHTETYGRHVLAKVIKGLNISLCVDLGCGNGDDLMVVKKVNPRAKCVGVDFGDRNREGLLEEGIEFVSLNIERERLPLESETIDLIIANQVLEHTKEIFWIHHEIFRTLKVGGYLYMGVPNTLSLHNRILGLFGVHPTCLKMISGHVRGFSKKDTILFYREIAGNFLTIQKFYGSQFYPFPRRIARPLAKAFPSLAFSIFFLIKKTGTYQGEFLRWLSENFLETNFYQPKDAEKVHLG
jgi:ubiquinone/menaquinone biosynthesis C-methylase UbiE